MALVRRLTLEGKQTHGPVMNEAAKPAPSAVVTAGKACFGNDLPLAVIVGLAHMESRAHALEMAAALKEIAGRLGIGLVYKSSFDKANRTSAVAASGARARSGAADLRRDPRERWGCRSSPTCTSRRNARVVAEVVDVLQIPAFLCRQTDLLIAAAATGKPVNVKKGQFLAPWDMRQRRGQDDRRRQSERARHRARRRPSATTRSSPTCARCRSWPRPARR